MLPMFVSNTTSARCRGQLRRVRHSRCRYRNNRKHASVRNYQNHSGHKWSSFSSTHYDDRLKFCLFRFTDQTPWMLLFSALGSPPFRTIKLRQKKATCNACSDPSNALSSITNTDYVQFCGGPIPDWVNEGRAPGETGHRIQPQVCNILLSVVLILTFLQALRDLLSSQNPPKIIDVRPRTEYGICSLPGSESKCQIFCYETNGQSVYRHTAQRGASQARELRSKWYRRLCHLQTRK